VSKPLAWRSQCSQRRSLTAASVASVVSILLNVPRFYDFYYEKVQIVQNGTNSELIYYVVKTTEFRMHPTYQLLYLNWGFFIVAYGIPLILISIMNWSIYRAISNLNKTRQIMSATEAKEVSLSKMLICITIVSIVYTVSRLLWAIWVLNSGFEGIMWEVIDVIGMVNSSVNFIFYCMFGQKFRQELRNMFCC